MNTDNIKTNEQNNESKNVKKKKDKIRYIIETAILLFLLLWTLWSEVLVTERLSIDLPNCSDGTVRIVLLTDLHSCYYGKNQKNLIRKVEKENPDLVILAGDIFDDKMKDDNAKKTVEEVSKRYPCYYVSGNHEYWSGRVPEMKTYLRSKGVTVLEGDCETREINGIILDICGVDDPTDLSRHEWVKQIEIADAQTNPDHVRILVSHRPERVQFYENYDFDLILSGHAHAGQIRIPILNVGLWSPNQGFFPKYVSGMYTLSNGSILEVSRGLARESTPAPRFFNHPEIVSIEIK